MPEKGAAPTPSNHNMDTSPRYHADDLRRLTREILTRCGMTSRDASISADVLIDTDLRGIDSHGIAHLSSHRSYVPGLRSGKINPRARCHTIQEGPTTALLDGDGGLGLVIACNAMTLAIEKAEANGVAMIAVTNSHHYGAAGYYSMMALPHDMIGISMTNASPAVLPTFGRERRLGTNAISFAVPAGEEPPYVLDMATSTVAVGKLELARRRGKSIPLGWAVDKHGAGTTEPNDYWDGGALLALGSTPELSSYKGYGLGILVDILSGVLSGVGFGAALSREGRTVGHFLGAIRIESFRPVEDFKEMMDEMIKSLRSTPTGPGDQRVLVPGLKEHETYQERSRTGIPLHPEVRDSLKKLADELGIQFPSENLEAG
jgi:LDH2 family malate/lactate/ureidoglycolate dehydrogenase